MELERGGGDSESGSSTQVAPLAPWRPCWESDQRDVAVVLAERGDEELVADAEENEDECWRVRVQSLCANVESRL